MLFFSRIIYYPLIFKVYVIVWYLLIFLLNYNSHYSLNHEYTLTLSERGRIFVRSLVSVSGQADMEYYYIDDY